MGGGCCPSVRGHGLAGAVATRAWKSARVHICYTNKKRMEINFIKMKELYNKKHRKGLKLDGLVYDDRSQAVILNKGMPIYILFFQT
jgi:hypothetical protein